MPRKKLTPEEIAAKKTLYKERAKENQRRKRAGLPLLPRLNGAPNDIPPENKKPVDFKKTAYFQTYLLDWYNKERDPLVYEEIDNKIQKMQKRVRQKWIREFPLRKFIIIVSRGAKVIGQKKTRIEAELYTPNITQEHKDALDRIIREEIANFEYE